VSRERKNWHNDDDTGKSRGVSRARGICLSATRKTRRPTKRRRSNRRASLILGGILTAPTTASHPTQNTRPAPPKITGRTSQVARTFHRADCTPPLCCLLFAVLFLPLTYPPTPLYPIPTIHLKIPQRWVSTRLTPSRSTPSALLRYVCWDCPNGGAHTAALLCSYAQHSKRAPPSHPPHMLTLFPGGHHLPVQLWPPRCAHGHGPGRKSSIHRSGSFHGTYADSSSSSPMCSLTSS
jgi:hypothetical protein